MHLPDLCPTAEIEVMAVIRAIVQNFGVPSHKVGTIADLISPAFAYFSENPDLASQTYAVTQDAFKEVTALYIAS